MNQAGWYSQHAHSLQMHWLRPEAELFRAAIHETQFDAGDGNMCCFPSNCCHHACFLFGMYLVDIGRGNSRMVKGRRIHSSNQCHHWLIHAGWIIDLTADQFAGENQPEVVVAERSKWHETWDLMASEDIIDEHFRAGRGKEVYEDDFCYMYQRILQQVELLKLRRGAWLV